MAKDFLTDAEMASMSADNRSPGFLSDEEMERLSQSSIDAPSFRQRMQSEANEAFDSSGMPEQTSAAESTQNRIGLMQRQRQQGIESRLGQGMDPQAAESDLRRQEIAQGRSGSEFVADTLTGITSGAASIPGSAYGLIDPSSDIAQRSDEIRKQSKAQLSPAMRAEFANANDAIREAAKSGNWESFKTTLSQYAVENPELGLHIAAETLPSMLGVLGPAKLAQALSIAKGGTGVAAGTATAMGANAVMTGGDARTGAYDELKTAMLNRGMSEQDAHDEAMKQSLLPAGVGFGMGLIGGKLGAESMGFLGGATAKTAAGRFGQAAAGEVLTELPEEILPQIATNQLVAPYDGRDPYQGIGETAAQTIIGMGPMATVGGIGAAMSSPRAPAPEINPDQLMRDLQSSDNLDDIIAKADAAAGSIDQPIIAAPPSGIQAERAKFEALRAARQAPAELTPQATANTAPATAIAAPTVATMEDGGSVTGQAIGETPDGDIEFLGDDGVSYRFGPGEATFSEQNNGAQNEPANTQANRAEPAETASRAEGDSRSALLGGADSPAPQGEPSVAAGSQVAPVDGEISAVQADAEVVAPRTEAASRELPGSGSVLAPVAAGLPAGTGDRAEVAAPGVRPAAPVRAASVEGVAPSLVEVKTADGQSVRVLRSELDGPRALLRAHDAAGAPLQNQDGNALLVKREQLTPVAPPQSDTSLNRTASWVIRNKATGEAVMETFDQKKVDALNTAKYEAVPILQHLQEVAAKAAGATSQAAPAQPPATPKPKRPAAPKSLLTFLKSKGGINTTEAEDLGGDTVKALNKRFPTLFRKAGLSADAAREVMQQHGWLDNIDETDQLNATRELISKALRGDTAAVKDAVALMEAEADAEAAAYYDEHGGHPSHDADSMNMAIESLADLQLDAAIDAAWNNTEGSMSDEDLAAWLGEDQTESRAESDAGPAAGVAESGAVESRREAAQEPAEVAAPKEDGPLLPPKGAAEWSASYSANVWDAEQSRFVREDVTAAEALTAIDDDIAALEQFRKCLG